MNEGDKITFDALDVIVPTDWPGITDEHLVGDLPRGALPE